MVKNLLTKYYKKKSIQGSSHSNSDQNNIDYNQDLHNRQYSACSSDSLYNSNNDDTNSDLQNNSKIPKIDAYGSEPVPNYTILSYDENIIQSKDYLKNLTKQPIKRSTNYIKNLFPIFSWIGYYPTQPKWIASDFITGISVAIVLVPQAMSYAKLAGLDPVYGLYSSFIGLMMYAIFATSKDVSIGPVAVMSLEVSKIINRIQQKYGNDLYTAPQIATTLALLCGAITLGVGLLRLGFLVELIPLPAVMAFTTSSALNIIASQLPGLMGYSNKINTHQASYKVIINFLKHLPDTKIDATFGLIGLFILYLWKYLSQLMINRNSKNPKKALIWTYILNIRTAIVIIFSTLISFLIIRHHKENSPFSVTGEVKSGLRNVGIFTPPSGLASRIAPDLPVATIVLVLEHISIAKSFGRIHDYKIDPNQEFIAIGVTNLVGTFFSAYPATGSFSRTALSSKCGVKTPFASIFAGFCVLLAIYCFTSAFYYIPKATLCAIIIHAVSDLMSSYKSTWKLYLIQPLDCGIFLVGVFVGVFASIEYGIYWAMCASCALIIWRMCWTNGTFMGRIKVVELINPKILPLNNNINNNYYNNNTDEINDSQDLENRQNSDQTEKAFINSGLLSMADSYMSMGSYNKLNDYNEITNSIDRNIVSYTYKWVPMIDNKFNPSIIHTRYINNKIKIEEPPPGVIVYRMSESFVYPNSSAQTDNIIDYIKNKTRASSKKREVLWNNIGEVKKLNWNWNWNIKSWNLTSVTPKVNKIISKLKNKKFEDENDLNDIDLDLESNNNNNIEYNNDNSRIILKPKLKVLHLDFSQVVAIDATSIQSLIDMKRAISLYSDSEFEIHFSGIINPWVIHGLINAGFGGKTCKLNENKNKNNKEINNTKVNYNQDRIEDNEIEIDIEEENFNEEENAQLNNIDANSSTDRYISAAFGDNGVLYPVFGTNLPFFHLDIPSYSEYD
ncbi:hypothetical protein C6P40_003365 [Pichia californica]|uniref:STAS domain-containing protein n=1 Tax=Pichia californica TaxID=460514 RepID=A0A9P6WH56_9ASCO|nr:hypothetical protein C6P40_003365 [[Candida] californica]